MKAMKIKTTIRNLSLWKKRRWPAILSFFQVPWSGRKGVRTRGTWIFKKRRKADKKYMGTGNKTVLRITKSREVATVKTKGRTNREIVGVEKRRCVYECMGWRRNCPDTLPSRSVGRLGGKGFYLKAKGWEEEK
jgi:hypothetical protein